MLSRPSDTNLKRIRIIAFSFAMVLVCFVVYYYFYVSNQTKYFTGRDLRVLAALSRHVEESVESQGEVFTNAVKRYLTDLEAGAQKDLEAVAEKDEGEQSGDDKYAEYRKLKVNAPSFKPRFQRKALDPLKGDGTNLTIINLDLVAKPPDESANASPKIEIRQEENQRWLYFDYTTSYPLPPVGRNVYSDELSADGKGPPPIYLNFKVRTNLVNLVGQFVNKKQIEDNQSSYEGDGFDAILLAEVDDAVNVIFQEGSGKLRIASLNNLTAVSDGAKIDLKLLGQSTNIVDVNVGAAAYKLFFQPVQLPLAKLGGDGKKQINWVACGFVESGRFRKESWSVPYTVLIVFGFLTVLVALSAPFLKLLMIGPKDRFRPIDTYLLVVSAVMVTALLTFFGAFAHSYLRSERLVDKELGAFAGAIQSNFTAELDNALKEIDDLNCHPKLFELSDFSKLGTCTTEKTAHLLSQPASQVVSQTANQAANQTANQIANQTENQTGNQIANQTANHLANQTAGPIRRRMQPGAADRRRILLQDHPRHYPYFMSAFWADRFGDQRIKWTVRQNLTNNVPVAHREYFYKLRQNSPYTFGAHEFYLQPIVSRTTGQSEVVISKRIYPYNDGRMWISALVTRPLSLMQPVVPSGFGFAIIDDAGKVLFHSDEKQHVGENFFEECDNDQTLRAAVLGRSEQPIVTSYLGKGHSMHVRPMGHFLWTVVVFRNKDYLRTTFSEILTLCLVIFGSYLLFMLVLMLIAYLVNRTSKDRARWLWPTPDKTKIYVSLMVLNIVLTILSVASVRWLPGWWKITVPVVIAFEAVLFFVWVLKRSKESKLSTKLIERLTRRSVLNHRTVYTINATLLFVLISIIPAYACFKLAYAEEMRLFIKEGQLSLAKGMAEREDRLRAQYGWVNVGNNNPSRMEKFLTERLKNTDYDVYNSFFYHTKEIDAAPGHSHSITPQVDEGIRFFKNFVPLFNQSSVERHALLSPAADKSWEWEEGSDNELVLHVEGALTATQTHEPRHIVSILPPLNGSFWWLIWPILLPIVAILVSYMSRHIFLFKPDGAKSDDLEGFCANSISQNLFLVLNPPFIGKRELLKRLGLDKKELERIDIGRTGEAERWVNECPGPDPSDAPNVNGHSPVVIDNFDFGIENYTRNNQRLSLLEKLHEVKRVAVAVSNVDPDRFMQTNGNGGASAEHDCGTTPIVTERWTDAISRFLTVTLEDVGDPEAFRTTLRARKKQLLSDYQVTAEVRKQIESVFETLARECSPRACLQSIGEGIAKHLNQRNITRQNPAAVIKQVLVQAIPYYKSIWRVCSDDEKLTLSHLAQDGLLSWNDPDIDRLMKKGLIVREPAISLMNQSFKLFVMGVGNGDALAKCEEKARKSSNWEVLKVPLTIGTASVIGFLLLTQREIYNSALPFLTALTAGVPSFFKLISLFHGDSGGKGGGQA